MGKECRYCNKLQTSDYEGRDYPPYTYDEWVCDHCWNNCPECGCPDWMNNKYRSTRRSDKKICKNCGFSFITKPATG